MSLRICFDRLFLATKFFVAYRAIYHLVIAAVFGTGRFYVVFFFYGQPSVFERIYIFLINYIFSTSFALLAVGVSATRTGCGVALYRLGFGMGAEGISYMIALVTFRIIFVIVGMSNHRNRYLFFYNPSANSTLHALGESFFFTSRIYRRYHRLFVT